MQHNPSSSHIPRPKRSLNWPLWLPTPGNVIFTLLVAGLLIMSQNVWSAPTLENTPSSSATTINYQGRLADSSGNALSGSYNLQFAIYDAATGGNRIWGAENHLSTSVSDGLFSVGLGSQTAGGIPTTTWNGDRYLEISVNGEPLSPRELIRSVPMALNALHSDSSAFAKTSVGMGSATTTSKVFEQVPDMSITFELVEPRHVITIFSGAVANTSATGVPIWFRLLVDGVPKAQIAPHIYESGRSVPIIIHWGETLSQGTHTIEVEWLTTSGTARFDPRQGDNPWEQRVLSVMTFDE